MDFRVARIPLLRPVVADRAIAMVSETLRSGWIGSGPRVSQFEAEISRIIGNPWFVALNSGTAALNLAYELAGVGASTEVITSPLTCLATNIPILARGATPVWADIKLDGTLDPQCLAELISPKTRSIVLVHFGGKPADIEKVQSAVAGTTIRIIEDAAHALGSYYASKPIGSHSDSVCFSFQAVKTVTTADGGGIALRSHEEYLRCRRLRWFGIDREARCPGDLAVNEIGYKYEMNDVAASIGLGNLSRLEADLAHRRHVARIYSRRLRKCTGLTLTGRQEVATCRGSTGVQSAHWLFPVLVERREDFQRRLAEFGIETSPVHYRNDTVALFQRFKRKELPMVSRWNEEMTCLPIGPWVSREDAEFVAEVISEGW